MSPLSLVVASVTVFLVSLALMQKVAGILKHYFTVPAVFYLFYVVFIYAGSLPVYFAHPGDARDLYLLAVHAVLLLLPLGIALASFLLRFKVERELSAYMSAEPEPGRRPFLAPFLILVVGALTVSVLYLGRLAAVPVLQLIGMTAQLEALVRSREAATGLFGPGYYGYSLSFNVVLPFLTYLAWAQFRATRKRAYRTLFWLLVMATCFMLVSSLQKAPVAMFFLGLYTLAVVASGRFHLRHALGIAVLMLVVPTLIVLLLLWQSPGDALERVSVSVEAVLRRIFIGQTEPLYYYFEVFPDVHPFAHGRTIGLYARLAGVELFPAGQYVHSYRYPVRFLVLGSSNSAFIGDMYANFGCGGMLVSIVCVGVLLQTFQIGLVRSRKTPLNLALYAFLCIAFAKLSQVSLTVTLSSFGVLWALAIKAYFAVSADLLRGAVTPTRARLGQDDEL